MSISHQQLASFLEPYQGKGFTAVITALSDARSTVSLANGDWTESDTSPEIAKIFCEDYGIKIYNNSYRLVVSYTPETDEHEAIIDREYFGRGYIFKDEEAFEKSLDKPCYVPELSDAVYTRHDFIAMCNGQARFAEIVFEYVDWQCPESYVDEQFVNMEWDECPSCGHWFDRYEPGELPCKKCGAVLDYQEGLI
jgi:hypothetical protein